jgi:hypothetical protein
LYLQSFQPEPESLHTRTSTRIPAKYEIKKPDCPFGNPAVQGICLGQIHNMIPFANSHQLSAKGKKPIYGLLLRPVAFRPTLADGLALSMGLF